MDPKRRRVPLADFVRDPDEIVAELHRNGRPIVLTQDGEAELVVQGAKAYQRLVGLVSRALESRVEWLEKVLAVREALASRDRDEGRSLDEVFDDLERELRAEAES